MTRQNPRNAEIPALWAQGLKTQVIANMLGLTYAAVNSFAHMNRELCPRRDVVRVKAADPAPVVGALPKRTILVPVVPNTGITQAPVSYAPVSVAAFSWDAQA